MNTDTQSPRFNAERQRRIEEMLRAQGRVEVLELARILQVSEHTVRRDLLALQGQGLLQRTHGGAVTLDTQRLGVGARAAVLADAKAAVGRAAAALVEPGQTVVLDAGSTPLAMARALTVRPLTVITSSLDVAAIFADDPQVQIALTGGTWQHENRALWGPAAVGRAAAALVEPGQTVVLDAGSTPLAMARALTARPLTVITSSLDVATLFAGDPQVQIALTGGTWQHENRALWGPAAVAMLANCRADWAVPGACAIDAHLGVSAPDEADAALKRAMIACARRTLILADHSKLGSTAPFHVAPWAKVHVLLIDEPWDDGAAAGVPIQVA